MFNRKISTFMILAGLLLLAASASAVLLDVSDPNLKVDLGDAMIFVEGTVGPSSPTFATIPLTIYYEGTPPATVMGPMRITILYDETLLNFESAESQNWAGSFTPTQISVAGLDKIQLVFGGTGAIQSSPTIYANINFTARCQMEGSVNELIYFNDCSNNHVVINDDYYCYNEGGWTTGTITIDDYEPHFYIPEVTAFLREEVVEVPVTAQTNFRTFSYHHKIEYDHSKLQFVDFVHNPDLLPGGCFENFCYPVDNGTYLDVNIVNNHDENGIFVYYIPELPTPTLLYTLKFRIVANSDYQTIPLTFLTDDVSCWPYNATFWIPFCDMLVEPIDFNSGSIVIPNYTAAFKAVPAPGNMISPSGDVEFAVQMQNNFPAGICPGLTAPSAAVRVNFDFGSSWDYQSKPWEADDFHFSRQEYENGTVLSTFFQTYDAAKTNWRDADPNFRDMFKTIIRYLGAGPTTYANRFTSLPFTTNYYDGVTYYPARVIDTSTVVTLVNGNGLSWSSEPVEFKVGEFRVPSASNSGSYNVSHVLSIRNNFGLDEFSVKINVGNNHTISSVVPFAGLNVAAQYINSRQYRIYSTSGFHFNPNGDEYTPIATITYHSVAQCFKPSHTMSSSTVWFTEPLMKEGVNSQFTVLTGAGVSSKCHGFIDPPPPAEDQIAKAEAELLPTFFRLHQNHPNPFNPETVISYDVPKTSQVKIIIVNILGQQVTTLVDEYKAPGRYTANWRGTDRNGSPVSSGVYLAVMQTGEYTGSIKMSLMK